MADALTCSVCLERFTETGARVPLALHCGHTACRECLSHLIAKLCPLCRKPLPNVFATLPRNLALISLLGANPTAYAPDPAKSLEDLQAFKSRQAQQEAEMKRALQARLNADIAALTTRKGALVKEAQALEEEAKRLRAASAAKLLQAKEKKAQRAQVEEQLKGLKQQLLVVQDRPTPQKPRPSPKPRPTPRRPAKAAVPVTVESSAEEGGSDDSWREGGARLPARPSRPKVTTRNRRASIAAKRRRTHSQAGPSQQAAFSPRTPS